VNILANIFQMGQYEEMTVLGNLHLAARDLYLQDLVAQKTLVVLAGPSSDPTSTINIDLRAPYEILDKAGNPYVTPTVHFLCTTADPVLSGAIIYSGSGGPLNAQQLDMTSAEFFSLLILGDPTILNYDTSPKPVPPTPVNPTISQEQAVIYGLVVADAQLTDLLPTFLLPFADPYTYCCIKHCLMGPLCEWIPEEEIEVVW
jgi:hypothetical protein